ncbi:hypothetical protein BX600DRAFT_296295 [Xylariales sp. PMI_506]|nr:hypothetical protein BX600DRAFT_296295 [Xylariales sp. PMI_506]
MTGRISQQQIIDCMPRAQTSLFRQILHLFRETYLGTVDLVVVCFAARFNWDARSTVTAIRHVAEANTVGFRLLVVAWKCDDDGSLLRHESLEP